MANKRNTPTEDGQSGYGPGGANPPNPSDAIIAMSPLPTRMPDALTRTRPFSEATRSPLHYSDGPGTDENVTSRRPILKGLIGNSHSDGDHAEVLPELGQDHNRYSSNPDESKTTNGVEIYGT